MLQLDKRRPLGFFATLHKKIVMPLGAAGHPMLAGGSAPIGLNLQNLNAREVGWDDSWWLLGGHSNCKDEIFPEIYEWWDTLMHMNAVPRGREF
jgi:hypothetical protein